jgi:predicted nuclease of predicted toxin-antitoxin system
VRFLVDAQLPKAICSTLQAGGHTAVHVGDVLPATATDSQIWLIALKEQFVIVSKDEDFALRLQTGVLGPKVVWVRIGNCTNAQLTRTLGAVWAEVCGSLSNGEQLVEVV